MSNFLIHSVVAGATALPGVVGSGSEVGKVTHEPATASNVFNRLRSVKRYAGTATFESTGLRALLDLMPQGSPALPYPCADIASIATGLKFYSLQQDDVLPRLKTGSVHELLTISAGQIAITRIGWDGVGEPITAQVRVTPLSTDGTTTYWPCTAVAAPSNPPLEADFEVTRMRFAGTDITELGNFDLSFNAPIALRYQVGKVYPQGLTLAPAGGLVEITASMQVPERSYHRTWGDAFQAPGDLIIDCKNYAQAAERGATTCTMTLRCTGEVETNTDGRPSSTRLLFKSIKDDAGAGLGFAWA
jgi:hypothetical protein